MGTKISRQHHRTALARDNIPPTAKISLEQEKLHNHLATKKHCHDPNIQKEALKYKKKNKTSSSQNSSRVHSDSTASFDHISSSKLKRKKIPYNSQLDFIDSKDLKYVREIGKGTFGTVHRALYKGTYDVALKTLNIQDENPNRSSIYDDDDDEYMYVIRQQASVMIRLRHANLLRIIGVTFFESQQSSWITDFMRNGSLLDYFKIKFILCIKKT
ncbi:unnamed protein product [Adineta steineri]|uniref:Protein kinase domain-containing protein n=1 Tax=Adineta steineri TaxID=433720 RepID=A0A815DUZ8_9BILA|nr:unnamed protein product [Adineta steineri]CAF1301653.1 unnamed protein product [Adineta steineri]CAF1378010.1 unnamed protein product [Adineta steineri]